jgi:hypothetical protein
MNEACDDRGPPWASLLDPVANARALADVQALGLRAAGELVERFVRSADDGGPATNSDAPPAAGGEPAGSTAAAGPAGEIGRLLEVWMELLRQTAETFAATNGAARPGPHAGSRHEDPPGVRIDLTTGPSSGTPRVAVDTHGAAVDGGAELWLHNDTTQSVGPVELHCGDLRGPEGDLLAATLRFEPARIRELPARSGRGIRVCVRAPAPLLPGRYRAVVQVAGAPDVWMPLEVVVAGAP